MPGDLTPASWARALLERLGLPGSSSNVRALTAWEAAEGGHWHNSARYNPLNTTQREAGAVGINSVGVKRYTSWGQGLDATATTLRNGRYGGILDALRAGTDPRAVWSAILASPWGTRSIPGATSSAPSSSPPASSSATPAAATTVPAGWHVPGTPWDLPTPGDAVSGVEGAAAGVGRAVTRLAILAPIVAAGVALLVAGAWTGTRRSKGAT